MIAKSRTTATEFEAQCPRLGPCELVRGEVLPLSPGGYSHSYVTINVAGLLWEWARRTGSGRVLGGEAGLIVETDPDTVRGADVAYISYQRVPRGRIPDGFGTVPPELVVEIVGKGQSWRDMVEKAGEYMKMGVDRVWVIDPRTREMHVFKPDGGPAALDEDQDVTDDQVLPGFSCRVADFFAE